MLEALHHQLRSQPPSIIRVMEVVETVIFSPVMVVSDLNTKFQIMESVYLEIHWDRIKEAHWSISLIQQRTELKLHHIWIGQQIKEELNNLQMQEFKRIWSIDCHQEVHLEKPQSIILSVLEKQDKSRDYRNLHSKDVKDHMIKILCGFNKNPTVITIK